MGGEPSIELDAAIGLDGGIGFTHHHLAVAISVAATQALVLQQSHDRISGGADVTQRHDLGTVALLALFIAFASVLQVRGEPRLQRLSALVLFAGTLVFAINLVDSFIQELSPAGVDRLVWSPDMVGCALFLVSGHMAMAGIAGGFWRVSVLFMVSAVASFVRPSSGDMLATGISNWGTLTGALCFAIAGLMQEFEHPLGPRRSRDQVSAV